MKVEPLYEKTIHDEKGKLDENGLTCKKLKRTLEVLSIICSTLGVKIIIVCFYGGVTNILGCKSPEAIFRCAFAFLVSSVILGILAMASSWFKDRNLQNYFVSVAKTSWLYFLFTTMCDIRHKNIEDSKKASKIFSPESKVKPFACVKDLKRNENFQMYSNLPDNLPRDNIKDKESSTETSGLSAAQALIKRQQSATKTHSQLQKTHAPFLFGESSVTQNATGLTKSSKFTFDPEQNKTSYLVPYMKEMLEGKIKEETLRIRVNPRNTYKKKPLPRIVIPHKIGNTYKIPPTPDSKVVPSSMETFNISSEHPKEMFNEEPHIRQKSYRNVHSIPYSLSKEITFLDCFSPSGSTSQNSQNDAKEIFNKRIQTVQQNLHKVQSTYFNEDMKYIINKNICTYTENFHGKFENRKEISDQSQNIEQRNLRKIRERELEEYNRSNRRFAANIEVFRNRTLIAEKIYSRKRQKGIVHSYDVRNECSGEGCVNFKERPVSPMEIGEKLPHDQVLEVSSKLKDMNF